MEVRLNVDEELFNEIAQSLGKSRSDVKASDITREALALFKWAAERKQRGLDLVAANKEGPQEMVVTPLLQGIKKR